jgi:hypothetical protein
MVRRVVKRGALFLLSEFAPIHAEGYTWWFTEQIVAVDGGLPKLPEFPGRLDGGYIALESATRAYVEVLPPRCPSTETLADAVGMLAGEQLACFGGRTLSFEGLYGCWICGDFDPVLYRPTWLAHPSLHALWPGAYRDGPALMLHLPEDLSEPDPGSIVRMRGHFDDPRSSECSIEMPEVLNRPPVDDADAETWCRQHFVVEGYDVLGSDPSFPPNG